VTERIQQAHALYCRLTGQRVSLRFDRERLWYEFVATYSGGPAPIAGYGKTALGHIAFQNHGEMVWFRNIYIRRL